MGGQHSWTPPEQQKHDDQHHIYAAALDLISASTLRLQLSRTMP